MDLEQTVRAAFVLREPGADFEDVVMARLSAGVWRASQDAPRRRRHILLIGALLAVSAAAAMLVARYSGSSSAPAVPVVQAAAIAPVVGQHAAPVSAHVVAVAAPPPAVVPPTAPNAADVSQLCAAAAAAAPPAPAYTVLVEPLQFQTDDPVMQSRMQEYYALLLDQLRKIPGLALVGHAAQATGTRPADFRITIDRDNDRDGKSSADHPGPWFSLKLETWSDGVFKRTSFTSQEVRNLDDSNCPAGINCRSIAASMTVMNLRARLPQFPTSAQAACENATRALATQRIAQRREANPTMELPRIRHGLEQLAITPGPIARANLRSGSQAFIARSELVPPLVTALSESTDDAFRKEVVTLLAVKFADDPAARAALASVAGSGADTLMRHVAERTVSGDGPWRNYVVGRIRDTSLPAEQRLDALYWMVDVLPLDTQKISAALADVLATLQKADGIHALADLLAGTQKEVGAAASGVASRWGQWAMKQIGAVNHPAAPELLIACFDAVPNPQTLDALAARRDDPRVTSKLESIAAEQTDPRLQRSAARYLSQPLDPQRTTTAN